MGTREGTWPSAAWARAFSTLSGSLSLTWEPEFLRGSRGRAGEGVCVGGVKRRAGEKKKDEKREKKLEATRRRLFRGAADRWICFSLSSPLQPRLYISLFVPDERFTDAHGANALGAEGLEERRRQDGAKSGERHSNGLEVLERK